MYSAALFVLNAAVSKRFRTVRGKYDVLKRVWLVGVIEDGFRVILKRRMVNEV